MDGGTTKCVQAPDLPPGPSLTLGVTAERQNLNAINTLPWSFLQSGMALRPVESASDVGDLPDGVDELLDGAYRYAFSLTHDPAEAEDLVQDACLAMLSAASRWERAYFLATIRNRFIDRYRRSRKVLFVALKSYDVGNDEPAESNWDAPDVLQNGQLEKALATLRVEEREALFLAVVEGYTAEEIAEMTARPRGTILSLLHRAKRKLRRLLEQTGVL